MPERESHGDVSILERLLAALRSGASDDAERAVSELMSAAALGTAADTLMRRRQWAQAAWVFARMPERDVGQEMKRRLAANLASLQQHRHWVYDLLVSLPAQQQFSIVATASGRPTIQVQLPDGAVTTLAGGPDPLAAAAGALPKLYEQTSAGEAIALCGMGDGYLSVLLAHNPPALFMDKQQAVYLIEPEPQVVLQCLMIHDLSGAAGPIEQARFQWFIGPGWGDELKAVVGGDLLLPCPTVTVGQGLDTKRIVERLGSIVQNLVDRDAWRTAEVAKYYDQLDPARLAKIFGGGAGRPPRVLLLTTRFSTVLQYSTRDTAAAFERLGWEARVLIEPTPFHRVLRSGIAAALAEFKPDLVFQIDHLRQEHNGLFPERLAFACWIQDHLPHLASREVGARVGVNDFVLTDAIDTYEAKFAYPRRQCIPLPKLTVEPNLILAAEGGRGGDIVFVSNASRPADVMEAEALRLYGQTPETRELISDCCRRITATYGRGESLPTYSDVCGVLRGALAGLRMSLAADGFDALARWLTHPFNDALYRQQALRWAAAVARREGLTLALYGKGWEANPEFAPFARGPVEYGEGLGDVTRRSRINLQVVPYLCLHQRLLDGLMAGGFFLVRSHPADVAPAALLRLLDERLGRNVMTTPEALARLPGDERCELLGRIAACRSCLCTTGDEDVVAMVRAWEEAGQLDAAEGVLPRLDEVSFTDEASLAKCVGRFAHAPELRRAVASAQRASVGRRLSYDAGVRRVVIRMAELLAESARDRQVPAKRAA